MRAGWLLIGVVLAGMAQAGIYKTYDKNGNVIFTDVPSADAQEVKPKELTIVPAFSAGKPKAKPGVPDPVATAAEPASYKITVKSPKANDIIAYSSPAFAVDAVLEPPLWKEHHLQMLLDGKPLADDNFHAQLDPAKLDRGQHRLEVKVINKQKKVLGSEMTDFFIQQPSVQNKKH